MCGGADRGVKGEGRLKGERRGIECYREWSDRRRLVGRREGKLVGNGVRVGW